MLAKAYYTKEELFADYPKFSQLMEVANLIGASPRYSTSDKDAWAEAILNTFEKFGLCKAEFVLAEDKRLPPQLVNGKKFWIDSIYLVESLFQHEDSTSLGVDILTGEKVLLKKMKVLLSSFRLRICRSEVRVCQGLPELGVAVGDRLVHRKYDDIAGRVVSIFSIDNRPWRVGVDAFRERDEKPNRANISIDEFNEKFLVLKN